MMIDESPQYVTSVQPKAGVSSTWRVLALVCFVATAAAVFLYITVAEEKKTSDAELATLKAQNTSLTLQVTEAGTAKTNAQSALAEAYLKEKISGIYSFVDLNTGIITNAAEQLCIFYEQGKLTISFYFPYMVGTGVQTTPTGQVLGTYSVKLFYDFATAQTTTATGIGTIYTLTTTNGSGTSAVQVKLVWGSVGGSVVLQIGSGQGLAYIKNSYAPG